MKGSQAKLSSWFAFFFFGWGFLYSPSEDEVQGNPS